MISNKSTDHQYNTPVSRPIAKSAIRSTAALIGDTDLKKGNQAAPNIKKWSGQRGSNPRHQAWEACTLPAELCPLIQRCDHAPRILFNFFGLIKMLCRYGNIPSQRIEHMEYTSGSSVSQEISTPKYSKHSGGFKWDHEPFFRPAKFLTSRSI